MAKQALSPVVGVVVALCRQAQGVREYLVIRRSRHVSLPGRVCFPGGRVERGEALEDAARREIREELGVDIIGLRRRWEFCDGPRTGPYPSRGLHLYGFSAAISPVDQVILPAAHEVAEVLWLSDAQLRTHPDGLPNTAYFLDALERAEQASDQ
jgi:8-oxo-dGTP pyrophosphatase MutT (NUDIX family)